MRTLLLGEALVDLICHRPVRALAEADAFVPHFGGSVANVAVGAARLGAKVALGGGTGDDAWGAWVRDRLAAEGVDLAWFSPLAGARTPVAFVTVDEHAEPSYAIYGEALGAAIAGLADGIDDAVEACDALFFSSNTMVDEPERAVTLRARQRALDLGRPVLFDPNFRLNRWAEPGHAVGEARACVPGAFLVRCNRDEARLLSGEEDPAAAAAGLLAAGARHVVVTLGAEGAILRGGGLKLDVPGVPAQPISAVGAGDAFMAVLLARLAAAGGYAPALAAALPEAVAEGARAVERWEAV